MMLVSVAEAPAAINGCHSRDLQADEFDAVSGGVDPISLGKFFGPVARFALVGGAVGFGAAVLAAGVYLAVDYAVDGEILN